MKQRHELIRPEMECTRIILMSSSVCSSRLAGHEMDVRDLQFADESFDVAIDKGEYPC